MQESYTRLLENNKKWVEGILAKDKDYFHRLSSVQKPEFMWIGCSDSRVPPTDITGTTPGEIFVHRNIANMVVHTDLNLMSVMQYAIEVLKIKHIIVCGHYGCGGIKHAMMQDDFGLINKWLRNIKEVYYHHRDELEQIEDFDARADRLTEFNVIDQVYNLAKTSMVQKAWKDRELTIHGWVYGLNDGLVKDLSADMEHITDLHPVFQFRFGRENSA